MNLGTIIDAAAIGDPDRVALSSTRTQSDTANWPPPSNVALRVWLPTVWRAEAVSPSSTAAAYFPSHRCSQRRASVQRQR